MPTNDRPIDEADLTSQHAVGKDEFYLVGSDGKGPGMACYRLEWTGEPRVLTIRVKDDPASEAARRRVLAKLGL